MLAAVAVRLYDDDWDVRRAAVEALGERSALSDEILALVAGQLGDENTTVRWAAVKALGERSALPNEALAAVAGRLDDKSSTVRGAAVKVLGGRSALPDAILAAVAKRLNDEDSDVRSAAIGVLTNKLKDVKDWINRAQPADCPSNVDGFGLGEGQVIYRAEIAALRGTALVDEKPLITTPYKALLKRNFKEQTNVTPPSSPYENIRYYETLNT
ncbi:uncharacterized protein LMH87_008339 [Akanthomyces muscarius]|uniref:HEAT repeat domain-containing protein n=1 Tax=Akanthomyces muscarius TaxID=2231603 RepID=A0A9W8UPI0_AKAMU|nr:uncharacterized protein LMH87_008339 [Akanthomyces muscarius]KAJ4159437.1 hypothetical protein LMH87_008339 [Akanthomyces muscarius]